VTRIIAGAAKGRRLAVPPRGTRPTADRAREGLFSSLAALLGRAAGGAEDLRGLRVLDLYAGSGAVGLEALSRGATGVLLVERDRRAADIAARNVAEVGLAGVQVRRAAVESLAAGPNPDQPYDVVFADPPYDVPDESLASVLADLTDQAWLAPRALVVVERATRTGWAWPDGFDALRDRRYGEATLWYGRAAG
jgi:16S rRNA (guanine966-N2)-methyltransferase